jgi:hypothetical protein
MASLREDRRASLNRSGISAPVTTPPEKRMLPPVRLASVPLSIRAMRPAALARSDQGTPLPMPNTILASASTSPRLGSAKPRAVTGPASAYMPLAMSLRSSAAPPAP